MLPHDKHNQIVISDHKILFVLKSNIKINCIWYSIFITVILFSSYEFELSLKTVYRSESHFSLKPYGGTFIADPSPCSKHSDVLLWGYIVPASLDLLPSRFSRVRLCATPWTAAYQASLSMGFSRQEHWSGLPFPSPMHESGKWKWSHSVVSDS